VAIGIVEVDRSGGDETEDRRHAGGPLEEVPEADATSLKFVYHARHVRQGHLEGTMLRPDAIGRTLPRTQHRVPVAADPEESEPASPARMRITARGIDLPPDGQLEAEPRGVELNRAVEIRDVEVGLEDPAQHDRSQPPRRG
jgi:hypothetical protein